MIELELPFPPSANKLYRRVGAKTLLSKKGREYKKEVAQEVLVQGGNKLIGSRIGVEIDLYAPDRRVRDIANSEKALCDAMEFAGVYLNDSQIDDLHIRRCEPVSGGKVVVKIRRLNGGE